MSARNDGRLRAFLALVLACLGLGVGAGGAGAATPAPAWSIDSLAMPTNFIPGDTTHDYRYTVIAMNIGGAVTDGSPIVLTDTLPVGLSVENVELGMRTPTNRKDFGPAFCQTDESGPSAVVTCTVPSEHSETSPEPSRVGPSEALRMVVHVDIPSGTPEETLHNEVEVRGGGAVAVTTRAENATTSESNPQPAPAGLSHFRASVLEADGSPADRAGSRPYQYVTTYAVNTQATQPGAKVLFTPAGGDTKDIHVALPPGLIGNPNATSRCTAQQFTTQSPLSDTDRPLNNCPDGSAVGLVYAQVVSEAGEGVSTDITAGFPVPLYNLVPPKGMPAQFGFQILGAVFYINTKVRTGSDYGITAYLSNLSQVRRVIGASVVVWGTPSHPSHDSLRGSCLNVARESLPFSFGNCPAGVPVRPFLRMPTSCDGPLAFTMAVDTWAARDAFFSAGSASPRLGGCASLPFAPTISAVPDTTVSDSPSGLGVDVRLPQEESAEIPGTADLRDATVALPEGVTVNPAQASGLAACAPSEIGLLSPRGGAPATFSEEPARCPDASKIGEVEIDTPLLDHPVAGSVYVAAQEDNPFGSLLAIYIAAHDEQTGVVVKLAGEVEADPETGQLTTIFSNNPQLPFSDFHVELFSGPRAALRTPTTCGVYTTRTAMKPWSAPESGPDATPSDSFVVTVAPGGGRCAETDAEQPHQPSFAAGTQFPVAGGASPLLVRLARGDGSQTLRGLDLRLPEGLVGKLAGIPYCPEAAIAQAASRTNPGEGEIEQSSSSCPAASQIGSVTAGAGAGPSPVRVPGKVYLTGPYRGAPLGVAVITPAVAGPFDLGTVVVRAKLLVNPMTTQVSAVSDPLPTILHGIPLALKSIALDIDRPDFTRNPTSCEPMSVDGEALSPTGQVANLSSRFQVGGCRGLGFKPRLSLRLFGGVRRNAHPSLRAELRPRPGDANIARAVVALPHSEFLDQSNIRTVCTRVQFAADQCPARAIYGRAVAFSPLLDEPLRGPVYLRSSDNLLPDLVVALRGQIDVEVSGRIDSVRGGIRTTFEMVPDAPVSKFVLTMQGGRKKGLLVNSQNLCGTVNRAHVAFAGHNGRVDRAQPVLKNSRCNRGGKKSAPGAKSR